MLSTYERSRTPEGLPATYEVIFGAAFGGDGAARASDSGHGSPGEFAVPLSALRTARR
jgi:hypothetical protein